jgi:hypothetical protein
VPKGCDGIRKVSESDRRDCSGWALALELTGRLLRIGGDDGGVLLLNPPRSGEDSIGGEAPILMLSNRSVGGLRENGIGCAQAPVDVEPSEPETFSAGFSTSNTADLANSFLVEGLSPVPSAVSTLTGVELPLCSLSPTESASFAVFVSF